MRYGLSTMVGVVAGWLALVDPTSAHAQTFERNPAIGVTGPVFFRNAMSFTRDRVSEGASSSLILVDGQVCVLTAKHLLTDAMGIEPSVKPTRFQKSLVNWTVVDNPGLYDPDTATVSANVTGILHPNDNWDEDVIVLTTDSSAQKLAKHALPLATDLPVSKSPLYVVGCPYSEDDACGQKIYKGAMVMMLGGRLYFTLENPPDSFSGFSGAPVLNSKGEVVAVLYGSFGKTAIATPLPEWLRPHKPSTLVPRMAPQSPPPEDSSPLPSLPPPPYKSGPVQSHSSTSSERSH